MHVCVEVKGASLDSWPVTHSPEVLQNDMLHGFIDAAYEGDWSVTTGVLGLGNRDNVEWLCHVQHGRS